MATENQEASMQKKSSFELNKWYYLSVSFLVVLSLITLNRTVEGAWQVTLGIRETTPIFVVLLILPPVLRFLVGGTTKGTAEIPGIGKVTWENITEIDQEISDKQKKQQLAGEAAKDRTKSQDDIEAIRRDADVDLEKAVALQELPVVQQVYMQKLNELVKDFNRNRHLRPSEKSTVAEADEIAYKMRSMAPLLFGQLDISTWLHSPNMGKQLAAIKYLDWVQDIEFAEALANRLQQLEAKGDTFQAYHVLLALDSMANQLSYDYKEKVKALLQNYKPDGSGALHRAYVKERIIKTLS